LIHPMRAVLVAFAAGASVGTVELSSNAGESISDVMLGSVLADQLALAPQTECTHMAQKISEWSTGSMFSKPESVLIAVIDGVDEQGVELNSECSESKECLDGSCYSSSAACVAHSLVSQSKSSLAEDLMQKDSKATVLSMASEARRAVAGAFASAEHSVLSADMVSKAAVTVSGNQGLSATTLDLSHVAKSLAPLSSLMETKTEGSAVSVVFDGHSVTLDTKNKCVRLLFGETLAIAATKPANLVMLAPRSVACMKAEFGAESAEAQVASALIVKAVKAVSAALAAHSKQSFSAIVYLPSASDVTDLPMVSDGLITPSLLQEHRRLTSISAAAIGLTAATIANFHIFGWMTIIMIFSLIAAAYSIFMMTSERDPLLYAKFRPEVDPTNRR